MAPPISSTKRLVTTRPMPRNPVATDCIVSFLSR
jgi:hypothetical protein